MKTLLSLSLALFSFGAMADGFICLDSAKELKVQVYNNTAPDAGTRVAKIMIVSDLTVASPNKTIATFKQGETLSNVGTVYTARVDSRRSEIRDGEYIGGTRLKYLHSIVLAADFSYENPVANGAYVAASLYLVKENANTTKIDLDCERYLKN